MAMIERLKFPCLLICLLVFGAGRLCAGEQQHVLQDMSGARVSVPTSPRKIADLWFAHNEIIAMLGAADRIAVTVDRPENQPWLFLLAPSLRKALQVSPGAVDPEALLAHGVDLAFVSSLLTQSAPLKQAGIPVMMMSFQDVPGLLKAVDLTAQVLGDNTSAARAVRYADMLGQERERLKQRLSSVSSADRPRVLHMAKLFPLLVDGRNTIIDAWIQEAGGRNAADVEGVKRPVTMEQIIAWDPDIIIMQGGDHHLNDGSSTPVGWNTLRAVREKHVYENPMGVFPWDRYGAEFLLQIQWAAGIFHPDMFDEKDLRENMKIFYKVFFDHELKEAEADRMLQGLPPL